MVTSNAVLAPRAALSAGNSQLCVKSLCGAGTPRRACRPGSGGTQRCIHRLLSSATALSVGDKAKIVSPPARYTLLIPTFNRPAHLRRLLGYLAARRFQYPIRILDSSSGDALTQNRETVGRETLDVVHEIHDPATSIHAKIGLAISSVESTYCSICADDDVLFTDELAELLDILDADPSLVVAHGYYVNFKPGAD